MVAGKDGENISVLQNGSKTEEPIIYQSALHLVDTCWKSVFMVGGFYNMGLEGIGSSSSKASIHMFRSHRTNILSPQSTCCSLKRFLPVVTLLFFFFFWDRLIFDIIRPISIIVIFPGGTKERSQGLTERQPWRRSGEQKELFWLRKQCSLQDDHGNTWLSKCHVLACSLIRHPCFCDIRVP